MDPGDSMSSGLVHDASSSVMADAVNTTDAASSEYRVMYFVRLSAHCLGDRGGTVVKVLCYKSEGRWFHCRWCHWNFSLT